ncbi:VOC family protein [Halalkalibacter hemicellulosilyticus]|uniref:PhnB protein n=1 Tax=Halalkalibacter hemicellulosilyticusJCM 9152 TaxID=1236971 RepID=W4QBC8_9BACI|nr:VOC family protein [Halalkalibacter hemicellulosilyticus]GAE28699.1 PhnB protein [Halalkalibacter hemicellulosilyticusJCM 9152]
MSVKIRPYLMMNGNGKEAVHYYEKTLGADVVEFITYGDMPDPPSEDLKGLVAHAKLNIGGAEIMLSDSPSTMPVQQGNQVTICISTTEVEKSKRFFDALQPEGQVKMPFQATSFSPGYGSLTDKFGVTFLIDTEVESIR